MDKNHDVVRPEPIDLAVLDNEYYTNHWKEITREDKSLVGPFVAERSGINGYRIVGGDGTVAVWVAGERNARCVAGLLNLAHEHELLG